MHSVLARLKVQTPDREPTCRCTVSIFKQVSPIFMLILWNHVTAAFVKDPTFLVLTVLSGLTRVLNLKCSFLMN